MTEFNQNVYELKNLLNNHQTVRRSFILIDAALWKACSDTLHQDALIQDKELNFVDLGYTLSRKLFKARPTEYANLAEPSVCSFIPTIPQEQISADLGYHLPLNYLEAEYGSKYYRMRFAVMYWSAVRDVAVMSKTDCVSYFGLSSDLVELLASVDSSTVIDYCHGNPKLNQFRLTCPVKDCLSILSLAMNQNISDEARQVKMTLARLRKTNHCEIFKTKGALWH